MEKKEFYLSIRDKYHLGKITSYNNSGLKYLLRTSNEKGEPVYSEVHLSDEEYEEIAREYGAIEDAVEKGLARDPNNRAKYYAATTVGVSSDNTGRFVHELKDDKELHQRALDVETRLWQRHPELAEQYEKSVEIVTIYEKAEERRKAEEKAKEDERKAGIEALCNKYPTLFNGKGELSLVGVRVITGLMDKFVPEMAVKPEEPTQNRTQNF